MKIDHARMTAIYSNAAKINSESELKELNQSERKALIKVINGLWKDKKFIEIELSEKEISELEMKLKEKKIMHTESPWYTKIAKGLKNIFNLRVSSTKLLNTLKQSKGTLEDYSKQTESKLNKLKNISSAKSKLNSLEVETNQMSDKLGNNKKQQEEKFDI